MKVSEGNRKLKHVVAELTLDNRALEDVLSKIYGRRLTASETMFFVQVCSPPF